MTVEYSLVEAEVDVDIPGSNLVKHATRELALLGNGAEYDNKVLEMVRIFASSGHSGGSAFYTIEVLTKILKFENLTPLTDDESEWQFHGEDMSGRVDGFWQNRRNGEAFSHDGGKTYYLLSEGGSVQKPHPLHTAVSTNKEKKVSVKHLPYQNKSNHTKVRAIRVTARNFRNVAIWCGGSAMSKQSPSGDISKQQVRLNRLVAQIGDFVVRQEKGVDEKGKPTYKFFRVKDDVFEAEYKAL